jgi:transposase InsO family protein
LCRASVRHQQAVEWWSDNGSAYIAKNTLDTATAVALNLCFTPVRSTESKGIAEAFVSNGRLGGQLRTFIGFSARARERVARRAQGLLKS